MGGAERARRSVRRLREHLRSTTADQAGPPSTWHHPRARLDSQRYVGRASGWRASRKFEVARQLTAIRRQ